MSDREISGFNVDVVRDAVRQPSLDDLYAVARGRRRRGTAMALAAVTALAATSLPLVTGRPGQDWARPEHPPQPPVVSEVFVVGETSAVGVQVTDNGCAVRFAKTEDLGRTWSELHPLRYEEVCHQDDPGRSLPEIRYQPLDVQTYLATVNGRPYLSTDAGRTWRDGHDAMSAVNAFPSRANPVVCEGGCPGLDEPLAVDPDSKEVFRLRGQPPSPFSLWSMYESPDGALWATYWPGEPDQPQTIARSVDRGATWQKSSAPERVDVVGVAAQNGEIAYLLAEPRPAGAAPDATGTSRLLRTTDGGRSWHEVDTDLPTSDAMRAFTIGSDQSLIVAGGPTNNPDPACSVSCDVTWLPVWVSQDGGRHFTERPPVSGTLFYAAPGRVWIYRQDSQANEVQITSDGTTWTRLAMPR